MDKRSDRIAARTRVAAASHRPPTAPTDPSQAEPAPEADGPLATVIPFGIFDADAEAAKW